MISTEEIDAAGTYVEHLRQAIHDRSVPNTKRVRAAGSCLAAAQEHHHAIVRLIDAHLYASAFALLRSAFEAYVRGEWLALCATDEFVERFLNGKEPPKIKVLLSALEVTPSFEEHVLSNIKALSWNAMCAHAHTGGLHVQRWNTIEGIEPNFSREEVLEVMRFAEVIATLATVGIVRLIQDDELAMKILDAFKTRMSQ